MEFIPLVVLVLGLLAAITAFASSVIRLVTALVGLATAVLKFVEHYQQHRKKR